MSVYYNDNDPYCCKILRKNIGLGNLPEGTVDERDIRDVQAADLVEYQHIHLFAGIGGFPLGLRWANFPESISIITGGFPCQDISVAGRGAGIEGSQSGLWREMARLVCEVRPDVVIVENSPALLGRGLSRVLGDLAASGYDAEWQVISAEALGAPHLRERVFIVAYPGSQRSEKVFSQLRFLQEKQGTRTSSCRGSISTRRENAARFLWTPEPNMVRVADGIPTRMDRLRGLGNSVVPQVVEYIGRCILTAIERREVSA